MLGARCVRHAGAKVTGQQNGLPSSQIPRVVNPWLYG